MRGPLQRALRRMEGIVGYGRIAEGQGRDSPEADEALKSTMDVSRRTGD